MLQRDRTLSVAMEESQALFAQVLQELVDQEGKWPTAKKFAEETGLDVAEAKGVLSECKPLVNGPPKKAKTKAAPKAAAQEEAAASTPVPLLADQEEAADSPLAAAEGEPDTLPLEAAADSPFGLDDSDDEPLVKPERPLKRLKPALGLNEPISPDEASPAEPAASKAAPVKSAQNSQALDKLEFHKGSSQRSGP